MNPGEVFEQVRPRLALILRLSEDQVRFEASLFDDLGAESMDLVELQLVLEELAEVEVSEEGIEAYLMGNMAPSEFYDEEHMVTPTGLRHLKALLPGFDPGRWSGELSMHNLGHVLTVGALCDFVSARVKAKNSSLSGQ